MKSYDLLVAGAGPAGLTLTWKAAELGLSVLAFDRKKTPQDVTYTTSGSFIDLAYWGLPSDVAHPIDKLTFSSNNAMLTGTGRACVIRRRRLLEELDKKCINAGAEVRYATAAEKVNTSNGRIDSVMLSDGTEVASTIYADCSGIGGVFHRHLPVYNYHPTTALGLEYILPLKSEPNTADLYIGGAVKGGYGWLFPISEKEAIVGAGTLKRNLQPKIRETLDNMLTLPRFRERVEANPIETHSGLFNTGPPPRSFIRGNLILAGDVALQGNPAAGEGIRFVMDSAQMAAKATAKAIQSHDLRLLDEYNRTWSRKYRHKFQVNYLTQRLLARLTEHDSILDHMIRAGGKASPQTMQTLISGEADLGFLARKIPKLLYKPFTRASHNTNQRHHI